MFPLCSIGKVVVGVMWFVGDRDGVCVLLICVVFCCAPLYRLPFSFSFSCSCELLNALRDCDDSISLCFVSVLCIRDMSCFCCKCMYALCDDGIRINNMRV